ncbi:CubicO group peptidase, beta-lactamase class C family [Ekhidna lutea]|uniref:CubicO group peptidase, beta-lactamase class C family n=1 Tax=Ekhidna lutea TaxID=447679 RepID=A0A239IN85_EKHLU|nr:serine hydrolase [Ekhidna lutea]SNS93874.1 CubicO group peptidase, beta-lactamase class C family [Ekhidna lutea]
MRYCFRLISIIMCASVFANESKTTEEVWIDGDSFYEAIKHKKKSTIYFKNWSPYISHFLEDENYFVAIQLGNTFDPLPHDQVVLPSLNALAAIEDDQLRADYFMFLESFGRTNGINHMVLPDTTGFSSFEKEVIKQANERSPFYFLHKSSLSYSIPESRKEFENVAKSKPTIWIADQDASLRKFNRWSGKLGGANQASFYSKIRKAKQEEFLPAYDIPESLGRSLFNASVVAIDPAQKLPLQEKVITYLGSDELFRKRLMQYAHVIEHRAEGVQCIVDNRLNDQEVKTDDIVINHRFESQYETALIISGIGVERQDVVLGKMLFGAMEIVGRSSVSGVRKIYNPAFLGYADAKWEGMNPQHLLWIDSLAKEAIGKYATPGIQLAVVKNGSIVLEKSYGYYTYDSLRPVHNHTRYDIASLTKVIGTLPAIALLVDQGKINLDDSVSMHLSAFRGSNKSNVSIRQLLAHHGGLRSYVPFWSMMMDGDRLDAFYYKTKEDEERDIRTYGMDPHPSMLDSLKSFIVRSKLIKNPSEYHYSDLGFMILHWLVEEVSGQPFDSFLEENFYKPMKLTYTSFNPLSKGVSPTAIAPTEYDHRYRNYQVWGEVHDRNALVFGGVAGHAGLFSTASDLAKILAMIMNGGYYGGKKYISKSTLDQFNVRYFEHNRRGLGWDKKDGIKDSASSLASDQSYGHTGFTGTMVWADPQENLIYVFLSNRIYPDANNWKLGELNTRTHIHDIIYQSIQD